jgi:xanthine dehydrogenase YagR molybdenum-binding subunit
VAERSWPGAEDRRLLGRAIPRVDGPAKVTGTARYTADVQLPRMLHAMLLRCPHAHARVKSVDVSAARTLPGVRAVRVLQDAGSEIRWALDEIALVAAVSELAARDAVRALRVEYEILPHWLDDEKIGEAPAVRPGEEETAGDPDRAMGAAAVRSRGFYALAVAAHDCPEPHAQVCDWNGGTLTVWCSTQAVSGLGPRLAEALAIPAANVRVVCEHMGGGFGSKLSVDRWTVECARIARQAGAPVRLLLERDAERTVAGDRASLYAEVEIGAAADGRITAWRSRSWGSGGAGDAGKPPLPYVFQIPDRRHHHAAVATHRASARPWRAPDHLQACFVTLAALEDLAARLGMNPLDVVLLNLPLAGPLEKVYREELEIADRLMGWRQRWHPRGAAARGPVRRGLGLALHTWSGEGHESHCEVRIHADGTAEARTATQDLGTGTRTAIAIVLAETLGLPLESVQVHLGDSRYPASGPSSASSTVGGVTAAARRAAQNALAARQAGTASPTAMGTHPGEGVLTGSGVGGVQMADVSVDVETGVVTVNKMVAVQDCGLIVDRKTAESQVHGGLVMGISSALFEEKVLDPLTGRMLNAGSYPVAGPADAGELVVHLMSGPGYDERGVIGLGSPPVISTGAALANAVANAIGIRVPSLPLTPLRVLEALEKGRSGG